MLEFEKLIGKIENTMNYNVADELSSSHPSLAVVSCCLFPLPGFRYEENDNLKSIESLFRSVCGKMWCRQSDGSYSIREDDNYLLCSMR